MNATSMLALSLPPVQSIEFLSLSALALVAPYLFILVIYAYHFSRRTVSPSLRHKGDEPKPEHQDWKTAIFRPEGITAVVTYMACGLALSLLTHIDLVPSAIKDLSLSVRWMPLFAYFFVFDFLMYCIHFCQHRWRWLFYNTHHKHHIIKSPTIVVALTGFIPDTCILIILPLHATLLLVPHGNFATIFVFALGALTHLHLIHSEFSHPHDALFRTLYLVNTQDHHVHHVRPSNNLAHFFTVIDRMFGTYVDPKSVPSIRS